jgi:hypothetical protein
MEIEIVTTKRKLNKHIVKQMQELKPEEISDEVEVIGYVCNIEPNTPKLLIVQLQRFDYRIVHWNWRLGTTNLYRNLRKGWVCEMKLNDADKALKYYEAVQEYKKYAEQIYL